LEPPPEAHRPPPPPSPDDVRARARRWRIRGGAVIGIGSTVGLGLAVGFQAMRYVRARNCIRDLEQSEDFGDALGAGIGCSIDRVLSVYPAYLSAAGLAAVVTASGGGASMLGLADAAEDVEIEGRKKRVVGRKAAGATLVSIGALGVVVSTAVLLPKQLTCDLECGLELQATRFIATDASTAVLAVGAGLLGHAVAYDKQGEALLRLRAVPGANERGAHLTIAGQF
jgi:hypothetical protein